MSRAVTLTLHVVQELGTKVRKMDALTDGAMPMVASTRIPPGADLGFLERVFICIKGWVFVGPTGVYLLDFFCSGIQFHLLLSPYLCFIAFLYLDLYVLGDDALKS